MSLILHFVGLSYSGTLVCLFCFFHDRDFLIWLGIVVSSMLCVGWSLLSIFSTNLCTDAHAIYLLNLLLAFLQPKFDPSLRDDLMADEIEEGGDPVISPLPSQRDDEFRPFVRRLPEWQFWWASWAILALTRLLLHINNISSFSQGFHPPVLL